MGDLVLSLPFPLGTPILTWEAHSHSLLPVPNKFFFGYPELSVWTPSTLGGTTSGVEPIQTA